MITEVQLLICTSVKKERKADLGKIAIYCSGIYWDLVSSWEIVSNYL